MKECEKAWKVLIKLGDGAPGELLRSDKYKTEQPWKPVSTIYRLCSHELELAERRRFFPQHMVKGGASTDQQLLELRKDKLIAISEKLTSKLESEDLNSLLIQE